MFTPAVAAPEEIVMTRPHPRSHMPGTTAWQQFMTPYEIDPYGTLPISRVHVDEPLKRHRCRATIAGVVHQDVDAFDGTDGIEHGGEVSDVE